MGRVTKKYLLWVSAGIVVLGIVLYSYLFRSFTMDSTRNGSYCYKYAWGKPDAVEGDRNRDGRIDYRVNYRGYGHEDFYVHMLDGEYWVDRDFDGVFGVHYVARGDEYILFEIDVDQDGEIDQRYEGTEAAEKLMQEGERWKAMRSQDGEDDPL